MSNLVTIDFHNTLFQCDAWFHLEVRELPVVVLRDLRERGLVPEDPDLDDEARSLYREIRASAMSTGVECDAVTSVCRVFDDLQLPASQSALEDSVQRVMWRTVAFARPIDGSVELVRSLSAKQVPLAVVSSAAYHPFLEWCLERFDLRHSFDEVITSASCGIYKSNPGIYQHTVDLFRVDPHRAIHIGDSHRYDVTSASSIGMKTILLATEPGNGLDPAPDACIASLGEALPQLDRLLRV